MIEDSEQPDLSLIPAEALIAALRERYAVMFFVGRPLGSDEGHDWLIESGGDLDRVIGTAHIGILGLARKHIKGEGE